MHVMVLKSNIIIMTTFRFLVMIIMYEVVHFFDNHRQILQ